MGRDLKILLILIAIIALIAMTVRGMAQDDDSVRVAQDVTQHCTASSAAQAWSRPHVKGCERLFYEVCLDGDQIIHILPCNATYVVCRWTVDYRHAYQRFMPSSWHVDVLRHLNRLGIEADDHHFIYQGTPVMLSVRATPPPRMCGRTYRHLPQASPPQIAAVEYLSKETRELFNPGPSTFAIFPLLLSNDDFQGDPKPREIDDVNIQKEFHARYDPE